MAAVVLKRLGRRNSLLNGLLQIRMAGAASNCPLPGMGRQFSALALLSKAPKVGPVSSFGLHFTQPFRGLQEQALSLSDASALHHVYEDADSQAAALAFQSHLQNQSRAYLSDAAAVVEHAPLFIKQLVDFVKQKSREKAEAVLDEPALKTKKKKKLKDLALPSAPVGTNLSFEKQVLAYLSTANINVLEAVLESVGMGSDRLQALLQKLTEEKVDVQWLLFVVRWLQKLGFSRSSVGDIIEKETGMLAFKSDEIDAGVAMLKGFSIPQEEILSLIMKYPLILKTEVVDNVAAIRAELSEMPSCDVIVGKAVSTIPATVHKYEKGRADSVLHFLRSYGLSEERIDQIFRRHFSLVFLDVEKKLKPKVKFLKDVGVSRTVISKVLRRSPGFLFYSLEDNLKARLEYFKSLGFSEAEFAVIVSRYPSIFCASLDNKVKPAVEELKTLGLTQEGLKKVVLHRPSLFAYKLGGDISSLVSGLKETDYSEHQKVTAFIKLFTRGIDHRKRCEDCLMRYGLSESEAKQVVDKEPSILGYNEKSLTARMEHLTTTLGLSAQNVLSAPYFLSFGFRKRFLRRQRVLAYMKSTGLLTEDVTLKHVLSPSNVQFHRKFVKPHAEDKEVSKIWYRQREGMGKEEGLKFLQDYLGKTSEPQVSQ